MAAPTLTKIDPIYGPIAGGTSVDLTGSGFSGLDTQVFFGDVPAANLSIIDDSHMVAISPVFPTPAPVLLTVQNVDGISAALTFYYLIGEVPSAHYSSVNPFFDDDADYTVFGKWIFAQEPSFPSGTGLTGAVNLGGGFGVFNSVLGSTLQFLTLAAGANITITPVADTLSISASSGSTPWTDVTGSSQTIAVNHNYVADNGGVVTFLLPAVAPFGSEFEIVGNGAGGWIISQNSGQVIEVGMTPSSVGVSGSVASTNRYDCVKCVCTVANTTFVVRSSFGNLTVT